MFSQARRLECDVLSVTNDVRNVDIIDGSEIHWMLQCSSVRKFVENCKLLRQFPHRLLSTPFEILYSRMISLFGF